MIIAIHQPNFAPWLGYFHKMARADCFVFLDDVQFSKNGYTNRVKIRGGKWLTIPVKARLGTPINACVVADPEFLSRISGQLRGTYGKSPVMSRFLDALGRTHSELLVEHNITSIRFLAESLRVETATVLSSELDVTGTSTERLISIVKALGGDTYLSGAGGDLYQDKAAFRRAGIEVTNTDFVHPTYAQGSDPFAPGLSALDFLVSEDRP